MSHAKQKTIQYLNEAHASEQALTRVLQTQIAVTPRGSLRKALETHLRETRQHADRVQSRISEPAAAAIRLSGVSVSSRAPSTRRSRSERCRCSS